MLRRESFATAEAPPLPAAAGDFLRDCINGLSQPQKSIPCKWLYDDAGSLLFERICEQPEYYPARTEAALLAHAAPAILADLAPGATLIELGSGASHKTRLLLDSSSAIATYVPVDISEAELARGAAAIRRDYLGLAVKPIRQDFSDPKMLDLGSFDRPRLGFFPGSTIGNMRPAAMVPFLSHLRVALGYGARLLLGIDLAKDPAVLIPAYDDAAGVTAEFNRNLLHRINRELAGRIDVDGFRHRAIWNAADHRIEMHLEALADQRLTIGDFACDIRIGETIYTEDSHKLPREQIDAIFAASGWRVRDEWIGDPPFLVALLEPA